MARDFIIHPFNLDDFTTSFDPSDPGFSQLTQDSLGDLATDADGFDEVLTDLISLVDSLDSGLLALAGADGGDLDNTFADALTIDPDQVGQNLLDVQNALPELAVATDGLDQLVGSVQQIGTPAGGGSGGSGGSGGTGSGGGTQPPPKYPPPGPLHDIPTKTKPLLDSQYFDRYPNTGLVTYPYVRVYHIQNQDVAALEVESVLWVCPEIGQWTARTDMGDSVAPGAYVYFEVTQHYGFVPNQPKGDQAQLHIKFKHQQMLVLIVYMGA